MLHINSSFYAQCNQTLSPESNSTSVERGALEVGVSYTSVAMLT